MSGRDERIRVEARGLWAATHQGPPPAEGQALLDLILRDCGTVDYDRIHSPHLRHGAVVGGPRSA